MSKRRSLAFAACVLLAASGVSAAADHPKYEAWLGAGGATGFEKSIFNVPNDIASNPEGALSLGFLWNLNARSALGLHLYGGIETTPEVPALGTSGGQLARYDLTTTNFGVRYRHAFPRGAFVPYLFGGVNLAGGLLETPANAVTGVPAYENFAYGVSGCVGPGIGVRLGRNFMVTAEGIGTLGVATWEKDLAANSSDRKFNPSTLSGLISLSLAWGWERATAPAPPAPGVRDTSLVAAGATDSAGARSNGSVVASTTHQGPSAGAIVLLEGVALLYSSAAYADDNGGLLAGITAFSSLGAANSNSSSESATKIMFFGLLSLAALEVGLGQAGATNDALFATSVVGLNALAYFATQAERKEKARR